MSLRLLPKDPKFFELFAADGDNLAAAASWILGQAAIGTR